MSNRSNKYKYLLAVFILFGSTQVFAGEELNAEKVKQLVVGHTMSAVHLNKDFEFKVYFDVDGKTAYRDQDGDTTKTTYKFEGNKHCIYWRGDDRCANIIKNDDGTYDRVNEDGDHVVQWSKIVKGKQL
ncbi:MAG TPA: hypothetical protein ENG96_04515 [Gammaproteobacteria bacterium]|nr:hypothetical protein [Gammaproteobacteria bacterium]